MEGKYCNGCVFLDAECNDIHKILGNCSVRNRSDEKSVVFKKLEKVGESYEHYEKLYQCYKLPMETEIRLLPNNCYPIGKDNLVEIEIKQKEDMEEKKNTTKIVLNLLTLKQLKLANPSAQGTEERRGLFALIDDFFTKM